MARIRRVRCWDLHAGDKLIVKAGTIRKRFHICEVRQTEDWVEYIYKDHGKFVRTGADQNDLVRVVR